jgi:hypothetical protein
VESLLAMTTRPVAPVTDCLDAVTLFRCGESASVMTGVPRPRGNETLPIGELFMKIVPSDPEKGHPVAGAVMNA